MVADRVDCWLVG